MKRLQDQNETAIGFLLSVCLIFNGCERSAPAQMNAQNAPPEVSFTVMQYEPVVLTTELPGRSSSYRTAEIRPQVNGLIQKRLFTEGADVEAGQVLYQIDPAPFQAAYDNAEANLAVAQKTADRARAALEASLSNIKQQQATLEFAKINRRRLEELTTSGAVSLTERDRAVTEEEVAQASLKTAEAQVKREQEAVAEAEAAIKQAEAVVKSAGIDLAYTRITAPITGRIGKSNVTEGAIVTAYQSLPLATIQQLDPIYVDVPQSTNELLRLQRRIANENINPAGSESQNVKILLEDGSEYPLEGELQFRDITVDPTTGSVVLRIVVPNPDNVLLPGMFVRAVITEGINEQALLIPQQAVSRDPKGNPYALLVDAENKVQQRMLTFDRNIGNHWLVTSGLATNDRVIIEGMQKVRPGAVVHATPFNPTPKQENAIAETH